MGMKMKVPYVFEAESFERPANRVSEYDPFGYGSSTWKIFYFIRKRKKLKVNVYMSFGRTESEALLGLVRALKNDWLNSACRTATPADNKITESSKVLKQFECVSVERFMYMCRALRRYDLLKEAIKEKRKDEKNKQTTVQRH